jgi:hypothetical protein
MHFWLIIDIVMVEKKVLAQCWVIQGLNEFIFFLHFENKNLPDESSKQFCFEFLRISNVLIFIYEKDDMVW